jgi:hypothetical protein
VGCCEHGNELLGYMKDGDVFGQLSEYQLSRRPLLHRFNLLRFTGGLAKKNKNMKYPRQNNLTQEFLHIFRILI